MVSAQALKEYRDILAKEGGLLIDEDEARVQAEGLIRLYEAVFKTSQENSD